MDTAIFATKTIAGQASPITGGQAALQAKSGLFAGGAGLNFMDVIFAQLLAQAEAGGTVGQTGNAAPGAKTAQADAALLLTAPGAAAGADVPAGAQSAASADDTSIEAGIAALLSRLARELPEQGAAAAEPDGLLQDAPAAANDPGTPIAALPALPKGIKQKLLAALKALTLGQPADSRPALTDTATTTARMASQQSPATPAAMPAGTAAQDGAIPGAGDASAAQTVKTADANGDPGLIAANLTPEQLTALIRKLQEDGTDADDTAAVPALIALVPPDVKREAVFQPRGAVLPAQQAAPSPDKTVAPIPGQKEPDTSAVTPLGAQPGRHADTAGAGESGFGKILKILETAQSPEAARQALQAQQQAQTPSAGNSAIQIAHARAAEQDALSGQSWTTIYPESLGLSGTQHPANLSLNGTAPLTSLSTQAAQAAVPHPGTQQVAALVTQSAEGGGSTMTLKLDPPELGRVEVRMEFRDDRRLKAVITADKPETLMMLQRDAHVLQRALSDSGADMSGRGTDLSFQLAQDGQQNRHNGSGGDQAYTPSSAASGGDAETVIETVMNWSVDAATGATRYDILA